jgi:unsaturated rhamnogalacturonyl hydrolase
MGRLDRELRILLLAGGCASACSIDERSFVGGGAPEGVGGQVGTAGATSAPPAIGGEPKQPNVDAPPGESIDGDDIADLDVQIGNGDGQGEPSLAGAGGGGGAPSAAGAGGTAMVAASGAGGTAMVAAGGAGGTPTALPGDPSTPAPDVGPGGGAPGGTVGEPEVLASVDRFFGEWPAGTDPLTIGTRAAQIFSAQVLATGTGHANDDDYKHYKDACAWYGSLAVARFTDNQALVNALIAKYQPYEGTWGAFNPPTAQNAFAGTIDDSTFGIVPLEIAKLAADPIYRQEGDLAADHQVAFLATQLRTSSDDMFHIAALQMQAYRASSDAADRQRHMDAAAGTAVDYLQAMQKANGLIPHHLNQPGFDVSWSRGNGWFAAGLAELMTEIPTSHGDYASIEAGYQRMMSGLLEYQIPAGEAGAGLWHQVVDSGDPRNYVETSGSAMFTYALITGVRAGLLDVEAYGPAARAAWLGLVDQLDGDGLIQNVSDWLYLPESHGFAADEFAGDEENYYFQREVLTGDNHGQSPLMWSAAALLRPLD